MSEVYLTRAQERLLLALLRLARSRGPNFTAARDELCRAAGISGRTFRRARAALAAAGAAVAELAAGRLWWTVDIERAENIMAPLCPPDDPPLSSVCPRNDQNPENSRGGLYIKYKYINKYKNKNYEENKDFVCEAQKTTNSERTFEIPTDVAQAFARAMKAGGVRHPPGLLAALLRRAGLEPPPLDEDDVNEALTAAQRLSCLPAGESGGDGYSPASWAEAFDSHIWPSTWKKTEKKDARREWEAMAPASGDAARELLLEIMEGMERYQQYIEANRSWYHPQALWRWLRAERWKDSYDTTAEAAGGGILAEVVGHLM